MLALRWPGEKLCGWLAQADWLVGWLGLLQYYCCPRYVRLVLFHSFFFFCVSCCSYYVLAVWYSASALAIHRRRVCGWAGVGARSVCSHAVCRRKLDASVRISETGLELLCSCSGALALSLGIARSIVRQRDRLMRRDWVFVVRT